MENIPGTTDVIGIDPNRIDYPVVVTELVQKKPGCDIEKVYNEVELSHQRTLNDSLSDDGKPTPPHFAVTGSGRIRRCRRTLLCTFLVLLILSVVAIPLALMTTKKKDDTYTEEIGSSNNNVIIDSAQPTPITSTLPTLSPTNVPTLIPSFSVAPSDSPTMLPSESHKPSSAPSSSSMPSEIPTGSHSPSYSPSAVSVKPYVWRIFF